MTYHRSIQLSVMLVTLSIASAQKPEPPPKLTASQLAAQIQGRDLSVDPLRVQDSSFELLAQPFVPLGNAVLRVRFHRLEDSRPVPRKLAIALDNVQQQAWLRDDGGFPDSQPSDGLYSAIIPVDLARILDRRLRAEKAQLLRNGFAFVSPFDGRQKLSPRDFLVPGRLDLLPGKVIPSGGFGLPTLIQQRSLIATHTSVINDPGRTYRPCPVPTGNPNGKWTFKYLMQQMANTPLTGVTAEQLARNWVDTFGAGQAVNGQTVTPRPRLQEFILDPWIAASGGPKAPLNLDLAPFELIAIVNRVDLRTNTVYGGGGIGELRFVFSVLNNCSPDGLTVIFEFGVPRTGCGAARNWAQQWAELPPMPSAAYNNALEAITEQVVVAGAAPGKPAGSALNQLRTNERIEFPSPVDDDWQMREYKLVHSASGLRLASATVALTPADSYNGGGTSGLLMRDYINSNEASFLLERHQIPLTYPGMPATPFRGVGPVNLFGGTLWNPAGVFNNNARHKFALNTCSGCHSERETGTRFRHIAPGTPVRLSGFLTGTTVTDPVDGTMRDFNDLERRAADLEALLGTACLLSGIRFAVKASH